MLTVFFLYKVALNQTVSTLLLSVEEALLYLKLVDQINLARPYVQTFQAIRFACPFTRNFI